MKSRPTCVTPVTVMQLILIHLIVFRTSFWAGIIVHYPNLTPPQYWSFLNLKSVILGAVVTRQKIMKKKEEQCHTALKGKVCINRNIRTSKGHYQVVKPFKSGVKDVGDWIIYWSIFLAQYYYIRLFHKKCQIWALELICWYLQDAFTIKKSNTKVKSPWKILFLSECVELLYSFWYFVKALVP